MICREIIETLPEDAESGDRDIDWVEIDWPQTLRRALRLVSNAGKRVDVLLPPGGRLRHGDVLFSFHNTLIAVFLRPCDVMALRPPDKETSVRLALRLGNLHLSAEVEGEIIYTPVDGPAQALADALEVPFSHQRRRFFPDVSL